MFTKKFCIKDFTAKNENSLKGKALGYDMAFVIRLGTICSTFV